MPLKRQHLFEFNDQPWLPAFIRNALTDYLYVAYRSTPYGKLFARQVMTLLQRAASTRIIDLCSGSGGPIGIVASELRQAGAAAHITLTDLFPREGNDYWPEPVDARNVPANLTGTRTMFAGFHHFRRNDAARILKDAFDKRCAIGVFEVTARTPAGILLALLIPFGVLLMTPRIPARIRLPDYRHLRSADFAGDDLLGWVRFPIAHLLAGGDASHDGGPAGG